MTLIRSGFFRITFTSANARANAKSPFTLTFCPGNFVLGDYGKAVKLSDVAFLFRFSFAHLAAAKRIQIRPTCNRIFARDIPDRECAVSRMPHLEMRLSNCKVQQLARVFAPAFKLFRHSFQYATLKLFYFCHSSLGVCVSVKIPCDLRENGATAAT